MIPRCRLCLEKLRRSSIDNTWLHCPTSLPLVAAYANYTNIDGAFNYFNAEFCEYYLGRVTEMDLYWSEF